MMAHLQELPDTFDTHRLMVRAARHGDGISLHHAVSESLAELRAWPAYLPWAAQTPSPEASEEYCRRSYAAFLARKEIPMLIFLKDSLELVGAVGLHRLDWQVSKCEVGYWGRTSVAKQGYITEAVMGITRFAFTYLHIRRIECFTDVINLPSRRVAERAGLTFEGIMQNERQTPDGLPCDTCIYAVVQ